MKKFYWTHEQDCIYDEVAKNELIEQGKYKEEDFWECDEDGYPIEAMYEKPLKAMVIDGDVAILKVVDMQGKFLRVETLDGCGLYDLLIESNSERMADLLTLYNEQEIVFNGERYSLICGAKLISELMIETAENMSEDVDFSSYIDEEKFDENLDLIKGA